MFYKSNSVYLLVNKIKWKKNNDLTVHIGTNLIQPCGQTQAKNWHSVSALKENLGGKWERGSGLANID